MPGQPPDLWSLSDLATPFAVHVAATLDLARHIENGHSDIAALAAAAGAHPAALERLLRHLVQHGLFEEPTPGCFLLNEPARGLLDPGIRLGLNLDGFGGRMAYAWTTLLDAVRSGNSEYATRFGLPFWQDLEAHPGIAAEFDALMGPAGHGAPDPHFPVSVGWQNIQEVVDVGGGTGALLAAVLQAHPHLQGTLLDLPSPISKAPNLFAREGVAQRARTCCQSFFDPLPAGASLYVLRSVLSDWPDPEAELILRRCAEAAAPSSRVVLLNGVCPDEEREDPELLMLVLVGGRARTLSSFRRLAARAGLEVCATTRQASGRFVVECRLSSPPESLS